ncbi:MAG: amino acid ABC transporter permease [Betaproteobacteria bacterium]|nr:amino acid ABC transporter permease [Betaproteobacteria bacterium]
MQHLIVVWNASPYIFGGSCVTVGIVVLALALGLMLGVPLALAQVYGGVLARRCAGLYVWFFRGVPILVQLFLFYFGLFSSLDLPINAFFSSCIVLGLTSAAYQSQIFRGAILSLPSGQFKAGRALGMSDACSVRCIILPQALRLSLPGWANEFSILLKDSAICFVLGTQEIMARTHFVASRTHEHLALFMLAGLLYFLITLAGLTLLRRLENALSTPGYAAGGTGAQ